MLRRRTRDTLRTLLAFVPLLALMVAIVFWMIESVHHDEAQHAEELRHIMK